MELDKLQVGDLGASPVGHGHPISGGDGGVGGVEIDLAAAPCAEHGHFNQASLHRLYRSMREFSSGVPVMATADGARRRCIAL